MFIDISYRSILNATPFVILTSLCFVCYHIFFKTVPVPNGTISYNLYITDDPKNSPRKMLLWNSLFRDPRWTMPADILGPNFFESLGCSVINCVVTNDKNFLPSIDKFDAVLFYDGTESGDDYVRPITRNPAQHYVFSMLEPPSIDRCNEFRKENGFFNLTMTYRLDSDIPWPLVSMEDIRSREIVAPSLQPCWRKPPAVYTDEKLETIVNAKTKFAVWFVSHCITPSKRENFVQNLQKYVSVDVYGACGPFKCKRPKKECDMMVERDYKFYIAFENSLCIDYVTEKLRYALSMKIIPVVFGGADYTRFAPPNSYINANNFKNIKELADYLKHLSTNPKEYMSYFWWRKYYRPVFVPSLCKLCEHLNAPFPETKTQVYTDMQNWWTSSSCYRRSNISLDE